MLLNNSVQFNWRCFPVKFPTIVLYCVTYFNTSDHGRYTAWCGAGWYLSILEFRTSAALGLIVVILCLAHTAALEEGWISRPEQCTHWTLIAARLQCILRRLRFTGFLCAATGWALKWTYAKSKSNQAYSLVLPQWIISSISRIMLIRDRDRPTERLLLKERKWILVEEEWIKGAALWTDFFIFSSHFHGLLIKINWCRKWAILMGEKLQLETVSILAININSPAQLFKPG